MKKKKITERLGGFATSESKTVPAKKKRRHVSVEATNSVADSLDNVPIAVKTRKGNLDERVGLGGGDGHRVKLAHSKRASRKVSTSIASSEDDVDLDSMLVEPEAMRKISPLKRNIWSSRASTNNSSSQSVVDRGGEPADVNVRDAMSTRLLHSRDSVRSDRQRGERLFSSNSDNRDGNPRLAEHSRSGSRRDQDFSSTRHSASDHSSSKSGELRLLFVSKLDSMKLSTCRP